jgi:hypothetical protein
MAATCIIPPRPRSGLPGSLELDKQADVIGISKICARMKKKFIAPN